MREIEKEIQWWSESECGPNQWVVSATLPFMLFIFYDHKPTESEIGLRRPEAYLNLADRLKVAEKELRKAAKCAR